MLHLHRASRSIASILNHSRSHLRGTSRCISSCTTNFNIVFPQNRRIQLPVSYRTPPALLHKHFFSTKGKGDEEADAIEVEAEPETPPELIHTHLPATVAIPEVWPYLPCIATSRNPVFPRFMKILEVRLTVAWHIMKSEKYFFIVFRSSVDRFD